MTPERGSWIPESLNPQGFETLVDMAAHVCRTYADRPAFSCLGKTLTYQMLDELADAFAVFLQRDTGLVPGDRIAIQMPNLLQYPVVVLGVLRAGMVLVNTNPLYTSGEMRAQFNDSGVKAVVIHKSMAYRLEPVLAKTPIETVILTQVADLHGIVKRTLINAAVKYVKKIEPDFDLPGAVELSEVIDLYLGQIPDPVPLKRESVALLQYTGGTTGTPKGAMLTHANLVSNVLQGGERISPVGGDWQAEVVAPLPLYHIYAFTLAQVVMLAGGHSILIPNPRDIRDFVKTLSHWRITCFIGLNTLFIALCHQSRFRKLDFSRLRMTISGGMALNRATAERWQKVTGCEVMEGYGLTEAAPAVAINPFGAVQVGSVGPPLAETQVKVIGPAGEVLPDGQEGELCVAGPQVMAGYWHNDEETHAAFTADGYLKTGDIAVQQPDGYLRIVDRAKDMIIVSGYKVYPSDVEDTITLCPGVSECGVIGEPDRFNGESVKAFVVRTDPTLTAAEVKAWCHEHLTEYKLPKRVEFVDTLPKTPVGKVLRRELKDR